MELNNNKKKNKYTDKESEDLRRMFYITLICIVFIIAEVVGGLIANSLAIISDAAHLLSDLSGFIISIFAMIIGKKAANSRFTFGYFRAEVVGALVSVITIWILTVILLQEAYERLVDPKPIDAKVMLITAIIGLICNLSMISVLHGSGHSHHGCSHGHNHNGHKHSISSRISSKKIKSDDREDKSNSNSGDSMLDSSKIFLVNNNNNFLAEKSEIEEKLEKKNKKSKVKQQQKCVGHSHDNEINKHNTHHHPHPHSKSHKKDVHLKIPKDCHHHCEKKHLNSYHEDSDISCNHQKKDHQHVRDDDCAIQIQKTNFMNGGAETNINIEHNCKDSHEHHTKNFESYSQIKEKKNEIKADSSDFLSECSPSNISHDKLKSRMKGKQSSFDGQEMEDLSQGKMKKHKNCTHHDEIEHNQSHEEDHFDHNHSHDGHDHHHDHEHNHEHDNDHDHEHEENINIKAAMIHIIGDIIQSVGVVIAAIIIYYNPNMTIVDPICTLFFSVIVLFTTKRVTLECLQILMEASPDDFSIDDIKKKLKNKFDDILSFHCEHLWLLSTNKNCFSCHIVVEEDSDIKVDVINYLKKSYKLKLINIQMETPKEFKKLKCKQM